MRIALPGVGPLTIELPLGRVSRWWRAPTRAAVDWQARAQHAELELTIERARARLLAHDLAARLAAIATALGWVHELARAPAANDDAFDPADR